ncbi:hypothetical protein SAMN05444274_107162 [Mariniphaga anaerophila]|uniref:Uncharacterized protein n=1 Tax=Mariniphaga anaerophila TaxID=1484053 RepID=A0A1M5DMN0_9BACT|nr:hypothetical protein SAMN05444274_107162 [Mariniphaga anaerophila]
MLLNEIRLEGDKKVDCGVENYLLLFLFSTGIFETFKQLL